MSKGRISIDQIVENGLESKEGLIEQFSFSEDEENETKLAISGILQAILPNSAMPKERRFKSGYRRFVVLVWMIYPDTFESSTVKDIAEELDLTASAVYKIRDELSFILGTS